MFNAQSAGTVISRREQSETNKQTYSGHLDVTIAVDWT